MFYGFDYLGDNEAVRLHESIVQLFRNLRKSSLQSYNDSLCPAYLFTYVNRSNDLKALVVKFVNDYFSIQSKYKRDSVIQTFLNVNKIKFLSQKNVTLYPLRKNQIPKPVQDSGYDLFKFLFERTLKSGEKIKNHYRKLYDQAKVHGFICPFCGLETYEIPDVWQQDYDHLQYKAEYYFSAINMKNLVPMGTKCNQHYKKTADVLFDSRGNKRRYFNPYFNLPKLTIDLNSSTIPDSRTTQNWELSFKVESAHTDYSEEILTWLEVFQLKYRYKKQIFDLDIFSRWLYNFIEHTKNEVQSRGRPFSAQDVFDEMEIYFDELNGEEFITLEFIKKAMFDHLLENAPKDYFEDLADQINEVLTLPLVIKRRQKSRRTL